MRLGCVPELGCLCMLLALNSNEGAAGNAAPLLSGSGCLDALDTCCEHGTTCMHAGLLCRLIAAMSAVQR